MGERLVGSVGVVGAAADRATSGLRSLFARRGAASPEPRSPSAAGGVEGSARQPLSPAARVASGLSSRWQSMTTARSGQASGSQDVGTEGAKEDSAAAAGAVEASSAADAAQGDLPPSSSVVWKVARSGAGRALVGASDGGYSSAEEEDPLTQAAAGVEAPNGARAGGGLQTAASAGSDGDAPARTQADFLLAQKMRMLSARQQQRAAVSGWGAGLRDRLRQQRVFVAGSEAVNAVALGAAPGTSAAHMFAAGHSGLKLFNLATGEQLRGAKLGAQPLTSLVLLPAPASGATAPGPTRRADVLCASYDACVHAYCVEQGRELGSGTVHEDAVSCLALAAGGAQLLTGSWDTTARLWDLAEGREPWSGGGGVQPVVTLAEDSGVWTVAVAADSPDLVLTGGWAGGRAGGRDEYRATTCTNCFLEPACSRTHLVLPSRACAQAPRRVSWRAGTCAQLALAPGSSSCAKTMWVGWRWRWAARTRSPPAPTAA